MRSVEPDVAPTPVHMLVVMHAKLHARSLASAAACVHVGNPRGYPRVRRRLTCAGEGRVIHRYVRLRADAGERPGLTTEDRHDGRSRTSHRRAGGPLPRTSWPSRRPRCAAFSSTTRVAGPGRSAARLERSQWRAGKGRDVLLVFSRVEGEELPHHRVGQHRDLYRFSTRRCPGVLGPVRRRRERCGDDQRAGVADDVALAAGASRSYRPHSSRTPNLTHLGVDSLDGPRLTAFRLPNDWATCAV